MTEPYYADESVTLHHGDALDVLHSLPADSIDAVVTDPPYELGIMGRAWDASGIAYSVDLWREALRVLKPGGHMLAFGGTRTVHRLTCAIEDAGFEIRDGIDWIYGSGFPKSLDVSKAIDKAKRRDYVLAAIELGLTIPGNNLHDWTKAEHSPGDEWWERFKAHLPADDWQRIERAVIAKRDSGKKFDRIGAIGIRGGEYEVTVPATDDSARWSGWGTALKPAREPIVMARKPLQGTVAANVLQHGTGALNVDACRVGAGGHLRWSKPRNMGYQGDIDYSTGGEAEATANELGRWPTNVVLSHAATPDGVDLCTDGCVEGCPVLELDQQSGVLTSGGGDRRSPGARWGRQWVDADSRVYDGDSGGASRFFPVFRYEAKADSAERPRVNGVAHPTVKPLAFMRWLVRLVCPAGGVVLDPFAGSGTTGEACLIEGFRAVLVEREADYLPLIVARLSKPLQPVLFGEAS